MCCLALFICYTLLQKFLPHSIKENYTYLHNCNANKLQVNKLEMQIILLPLNLKKTTE